MPKSGRHFVLPFAIGVLGLVVGISYMISGFSDPVVIRDVVIGSVCTLLGIGWLFYQVLQLSERIQIVSERIIAGLHVIAYIRSNNR